MRNDLFTQSRLQDFNDCAYRYLLRYIRHVENPTILGSPGSEFEETLVRGSTLHRMAERYLSGVSAESVLASITDPVIRDWWSRLVKLGLDDLPAQRYPEITLVAPIAGVQLAAKIDLLAIGHGNVVIVDWKTSRKSSAAKLEERLQTKVYRWVVCTAMERAFGLKVPPEQIVMRYWHVTDASPAVDIAYSQAQLRSDEADLTRLIKRVQSESEFKRTRDTQFCQLCEYRSICQPNLPAGHELAESILDGELVDSRSVDEGWD